MPALGIELMQYTIDRAPTIVKEKDMLFWKLSSTGVFSVKTAWDSIRHRGRADRMSCMVWSTPLPTQSKLIVWRHLKAVIPVDLVVKQCGVSLSSKCVCCDA